MAKEDLKAKKIHVKKGDPVVVIAGKDVGKRSKVLSCVPKEGKVLVDKVNIVSRHEKPTKAAPQGGVVKKEAAIDASNVMLYCRSCDKGVRVKHEVLGDGTKVRKCAKCGANFDK